VIAGGLMGLDPRSKGWELTPYERQILGLVLALIERPQIIALDGVEDGLTAREQAALWVELERIARTGVALLVSAREADADRVATIVHLDGARRPAGTGESLVTPALVPPSIGTAGQPAAHPVVVENASRDGEPPDSTPVEDVAAKSAQVDSPSGVGVPAEGASATGAVAEEAQPAGGPADGEVHGGPIDGADDRESGETS
jgi:ABC-2 type transport system ATP-binding protein